MEHSAKAIHKVNRTTRAIPTTILTVAHKSVITFSSTKQMSMGVWNTDTGKYETSSINKGVYDIHACGRSHVALVGQGEKFVTIYNIDTMECVNKVPIQYKFVCTVGNWNSNEALLAHDKSIQILDIITGKERYSAKIKSIQTIYFARQFDAIRVLIMWNEGTSKYCTVWNTETNLVDQEWICDVNANSFMKPFVAKKHLVAWYTKH